MANDLSANPMRLDTALAYIPGNVTPQNASILWFSNLKVHHFEFVGYGAQGNQAIIKDRNGKIVAQLTGAADLEEVRTSNVGWIEGLVMDTIQGNGVVYVYLA